MQLTIESTKIIEEGKHFGEIVAVEYRDTPFKYTDIVIKTADGIEVSAGYPTKVNQETGLGKILHKFGANLEVGKTIDPETVLVGKKCSFVAITDGKYSKVLPESVQPKA